MSVCPLCGSSRHRNSGTVSHSYPVARKPYRCMTCNGPIEKGDRYYRWTGRSDAWIGLATLIECGGCCARYGRPVSAC